MVQEHYGRRLVATLSLAPLTRRLIEDPRPGPRRQLPIDGSLKMNGAGQGTAGPK